MVDFSAKPEFETTGKGWQPAFAAVIAVYAAMLVRYPAHFYADDSYFYFQVARNLALGHGSTFNGILNTNGYHPLWMLLCSLIYLMGFGTLPALHAIATTIVILNLGSIFVVRRLLLELRVAVWFVALLLLVPFGFTSQLGTEGSLSGLLVVSAVLWGYRMVESPSLRLAIAFHTLAALAVLARLDNIFLISMLWCSTVVLAPRDRRRAILRLHLTTVPIYLVLWGGYLSSNWIFFHTLQPISGILKSNSDLNHALLANLAVTGTTALCVAGMCLAYLSITWRTLFLRAFAIPMFLGILMHAAYICFRMSSETRWSWYYTTWILLSSIVLAIAAQVFLNRNVKAQRATSWVIGCTLLGLIAVGLVRLTPYNYKTMGNGEHPGFDVFTRQHGIDTALAYDKVGRLAYFSSVRIVPLDGLMGNIGFQRDLSRVGVLAFAKQNGIHFFIGPPLPTGKTEPPQCNSIFLGSSRFLCDKNSDGEVTLSGIQVYSRSPFGDAGVIPLIPSHLVYSDGYITIWRL